MTTSHPLDPLTAEEISAVRGLVVASAEYDELERGGRFITIELRSPAKAALIDRIDRLERGERPPELPREADVVLLDRADASTHEITIALDGPRLLEWRRLEGVQPLAVVEELAEAEELVKRDPAFQAALAKRGVTDFDAVQIDAWPPGNFGDPSEEDGRLARCVAFIQPRPGDSEWAHPVDGLIALVDLTRLEVLRIDDHGVVPIPAESGNFDVEAAIADAGALRDDIKPLEITQPEGPSFEVDGRVVRWQNWELHVGFTPREGLVLNEVAYRDRGVRRSIIHRASLSEMVVPYGDPGPDALLQERLRRGRERRRDRGLLAHAGLRLPRRNPLPRRDRLERQRRSGADPERDLHPRGGRRRALAAHRVADGGGGGAARAPAGDLVVLGDRQLRLRLLLVPAAGRDDRQRGQAHRGALDRRGGPGRDPGARRAGGTRTQRDGAPALLQPAPRPRRRRHRELGGRGLDKVDAPRAGEPARERVRGRAPAAEHRARGQAARRPGLGPLVGDREPTQAPPARGARGLPARAGRERPALRRSPTRR